MKILIGYDGSECADNALEDLKDAGLPKRAEVLVLNLTENLVRILENHGIGLTGGEDFDYKDSETQKKLLLGAEKQMKQANKLAQKAAERVRFDFPHWDLRGEAVAEFAEYGIIEEAEKFQPYLIIVGSHGRRAFERFFLGSFSLKVLTEANCSVRVARRAPARTADDDSPTRIIIGFDGSPDSMLAVEWAARRTWRQDGAARLVTAIEPRIHPLFNEQMQKVETARRTAVKLLESAGLHVSTVTKLGAAKYVLIEEAESWGADSIFIGAKGHRWTQRVLLGSVSYSLAARARCSVEVVRENGYL